MMAPFLIAGICVVVGLLFVLFAFIDPPWWLQPFFDVNFFYFLSFRTQRMVIGAFLIVVPPTMLLGFSDYL
jgi:hypothetical protein